MTAKHFGVWFAFPAARINKSLAEANKPGIGGNCRSIRKAALGQRAAMNDLRALHLIYNAIKHYQAFGVSPEIRDELLRVAGRAIGSKPQSLCAAISQIEIEIAKLRGGQRNDTV